MTCSPPSPPASPTNAARSTAWYWIAHPSRRQRSSGSEPRALHLEIPGEPAARLRPRHSGGHHAMLRARHARNQAHELDPMAAEVLVAPSPFAAPVVVFGIQRLTDEPPPTKTTQEPKKAGRKRPRHLEASLTENQLPYTICCLKIQGSSKRFRTSAESQSPSANS